MPARPRTILATAALVFPAVTLLLSCSHAADKPQGSTAAAPSATAGAAATREPGAAFEVVRRVLQSPRCMNCHPVGDVPLQGDDHHVHPMHVQRGARGDGVPGLRCSTCHGTANPPESYGPHMPPGVSDGWSLPPPDMKMVFEGRSPRELCEQIKDPDQNGGRDHAAMLEHFSTPLVQWGWSPGAGRAPVPVPYAEFIAAYKTWASAGAPCPVR
jgi:hypothetical protein